MQVENVLVGMFGAFVGADLVSAALAGPKPEPGFHAGPLLAAVAGASLALVLLGLMRQAVGPLKPGKAKPVRR